MSPGPGLRGHSLLASPRDPRARGVVAGDARLRDPLALDPSGRDPLARRPPAGAHEALDALHALVAVLAPHEILRHVVRGTMGGAPTTWAVASPFGTADERELADRVPAPLRVLVAERRGRGQLTWSLPLEALERVTLRLRDGSAALRLRFHSAAAVSAGWDGVRGPGPVLTPATPPVATHALQTPAADAAVALARALWGALGRTGCETHVADASGPQGAAPRSRATDGRRPGLTLLGMALATTALLSVPSASAAQGSPLAALHGLSVAGGFDASGATNRGRGLSLLLGFDVTRGGSPLQARLTGTFFDRDDARVATRFGGLGLDFKLGTRRGDVRPYLLGGAGVYRLREERAGEPERRPGVPVTLPGGMREGEFLLVERTTAAVTGGGYTVVPGGTRVRDAYLPLVFGVRF